ncbi:hypothetical protein XI00_04925 [Bradyrhizobium sp. CCBAU 21359]|uniref:glycosyltransferase family 2 protein n=1 Tax=Bradyrhizobium sp. CCBAU 21359 TaxID=1325080 RepID=UPI002305BBE0|nr:glycosyltransferase family 2 protein [Bradyrhizobium sp. CCBAU 21359]MDA9453637.1 hypothetical protein [Bradyrhizobium sp. CCBAU 21359]
MRNTSIAIAILTKNEETNIARCIESHRECGPIYVVDSGSSDNTTAIATSLGATILFREWTGFADQRNYVIEELRDLHDWIVFIDADEIFDLGAFDFIQSDLTGTGFDIIYVSQTIYLNGKPLHHAPGYPIYHPRIARTSRARFVQNQSGHGEAIDSSRRLKVHYLNIPYKHHITSHGIQQWLTKHIGLAKLEAFRETKIDDATTRRMRINILIPDNLLRPIIRFAYHFLFRQGFRDGREGLIYSAMYAWFELTKWIIRCDSELSSGTKAKATLKDPL